MDFFDKLASKSKDVADKAKKMAEVASLNSQINSKETEVRNVYREIGQLIYANKAAWKDVDLTELFGKIEAAETEIQKIRDQILAIKEIKICTQCGAEIEKTAAFCPKCGAVAPVVAEPVAEETEAVVETTAEIIAEEVVEEAVETETTAE